MLVYRREDELGRGRLFRLRPSSSSYLLRLCNPVHPYECSIHDNRLVSTPSIGDVILRESIDGRFLVLDAIKRTRLAGPFHLLGALAFAREHHAPHIFQQAVDNRGRLLGAPARLPWS